MVNASSPAPPTQTPAGPRIFSTLNGLRGLAAISVLLFHRRHWFGDGFLFPDAYLAVDFFFILSGFVIYAAYAPKLVTDMPLGSFLVRRLNRLMPLVFLSGAIEAAVTIVKYSQAHTPIPPLFGLDVLGALTTFPAFWNTDAWQLNPPEWSLFFELFVNLVFGALLVGLRRDISNIVLPIALVAFLFVYRNIYSGAPDLTSQIVFGFPRVIFFFFLGAILYKVRELGPFRHIRLNLALGSILLLLSFAIHDDWALGSAIRLFCLLIVYPLVIIGGSNAEPSGPVRKVSEMLGDLSYPLYILQMPILGTVAGLAAAVGLGQEPTSMPGAIARFLTVILICWAILKAADEPVRKHLDAWARRWAPARASAPKVG
jgi:peptidoglycan/LPS O-acetylase OafA/YrhL